MSRRIAVGERAQAARPDRRRDELIAGLVEVFLAEGFADLSIEDLARRLQCSKSTLYTVERSKEQIVATVVRAFFRRSTERVEARLLGIDDVALRIETYLRAIAEELSPASPAFFADVDEHPQTREIYRRNTQLAAQRVQAMVLDHDGAAVDAPFVGAVAGLVMEAVHRGEVEASTGLDDAGAYRALAALLVRAVT